MKEFWNKLSDLKKMLFLGAVIGVVITCVSLIGLFFGQPGWAIGSAIGTVVELIGLAIQYKSSEILLKGNKPGIYILLFISRVILLILPALLIAIFEFKYPLAILKNAIFGFIIGIFPTAIITIFGTRSSLKEEK